ncbi:MAG: diguanylate cyclase [Lachnospiraceae bacterium]|nr:diguanylate cyclase [Lachnospiraceae bacterium]MBQ9608369.1 diguanylate cyclase [Lachnospiraceae bacterium]
MKNNQISVKEVFTSIGIKDLIAFVLIFVSAMIFIYFDFNTLYKLEKENIVHESEKSAARSAQELNYYLLTSIETVKLASHKLDNMLDNNVSSEEILSYLEEESENISSAIDENYTGLYGCFKGEFLDGAGWIPDEDYVVTERPWYLDALASDGEIIFVNPYLDSQTHTVMMTISRLLSDKESVIALDLSLAEMQKITEAVVNDSDSEYAMVLDSSGGVVAHSDSEELGKNYLEEKNSLGSAIAKELFTTGKQQFQITYKTVKYIVYAEEIGDGWYSISVINGTLFFKPLRTIIVVSILAILLFTVILSTIFYNISVKHIETKKLNQQLESIAHIYVSMHDIDLINNSFSEISNNAETLTELLRDSHENAKETLHSIMEIMTAERSKKIVLDFLDFNTLDERLANTDTITIEFIDKDDIWCRGRFVVSERDEAGNPTHVLWMVEIIDDEKRQQEKLLYLSETDRMTGINNRGSGEKKIRELIAEGQGGMFVLMDVDKFKSVNDNYGHSVGDKVLIELANSLKKAFRANDIIMRLGGDEFAVYVPDVHNEASGERIINRLFNVLDNTDIPELKGNKFYISAGAAFYQTDDKYSFEELYKRADSCTYISKEHKGNYVSYYEA